MKTTVGGVRERKADFATLVIGLFAVGLLLWGVRRFPIHEAQRTVALTAAGLALTGILVAAVGSRSTRRPRLLTVVGALVNVGVFPYSVAVAGMSRPRVGYFVGQAATEVRAVMAAQASYKQANGGYYDSQLECLIRPGACIPDYPSGREAVLSQESLGTPRAWYAFALRSGPRPSPLPRLVSQTSVLSYAYVAAPVDPSSYASWGVCGDSTGVVCWTTDGTTPEVSPDGACVVGQCRPVD